MTTPLDIAALANATLYPVVLLIIFLLFRKEIPALLKSISGRLTKLEVAGVSLELAKAEPFEPNWVSQGTLDLRHKASSINVNDSTAGNFLSQLKVGGSADYVIVNLGSGEEWLSSRLYIMAIIFERMKGVNGIVFLETTSNTRKKFVGWAEPEKVRWGFAQRFPWLETAYSEAYFNTLPGVSIVSYQGRLGYDFDPDSPNPSINLLQKFLEKIQFPPGNPTMPGEEVDWITLPSSDNIQEHAIWLNAGILEDILGEVLITESIKSDSGAITKEQQIKRCLTLAHPFITVVKENYRFDYLVKQEKLLEQIISR